MTTDLPTGALWVVAAVAAPAGGAIGGGSQSARNLLLGLHDTGVAFTFVAQILGRLATAAPTVGEFGAGLQLDLPVPERWAEPDTAAVIRKMVGDYRPRLIHLLDPVPHLGSWLEAVRDLPIPVIYTALDYNWLCANSLLLTRHGVQCPGPPSAAACERCHFDHREPLKSLAFGVQRFAASLPPAFHVGPVRGVRRGIDLIRGRLAGLPDDFARLDALIAPSRALAERFVANGFPAAKVHHVPYGTRPGQRIPLAERPPLTDGVAFGFAGRLEYDKGIDLLLDALATVRGGSRLPVMLRAYGAASETGFNRGIRRRMASPPYLDWTSLGQFDGRDPQALDDVHRRLHFFVAPSRWTDNLPNAVLEALERGTPVVAPRQGSFVELIEHGRNGWLYEADTPTGLRDQLNAVVANPAGHWNLPFDVTRTRPPAAEASDVLGIYRSLEALATS